MLQKFQSANVKLKLVNCLSHFRILPITHTNSKVNTRTKAEKKVWCSASCITTLKIQKVHWMSKISVRNY